MTTISPAETQTHATYEKGPQKSSKAVQTNRPQSEKACSVGNFYKATWFFLLTHNRSAASVDE